MKRADGLGIINRQFDMRRSICLSVIAFNYLSSGLEYPKYQYKLEKSYLDLEAETSAGNFVKTFKTYLNF